MKLIDKIIRSQLELTRPIADGTPLDVARSYQDRIGRVMHFSHKRDVVVMDAHQTEPECALIVPRDELRGGIIMYIHGGGYVGGTVDYAKGFASVLSAECGIRVLAVEYRLAPENPYPAPLDDCLAAYHKLVRSGTAPENIILAGDSAGGGLCYALALKLKELGEPQPAGIIAISPWVDLTLSGDSYVHNKEADPSLTRDRLEFYVDCYLGTPYCDVDMSPKRAKALTEEEKHHKEELRHEPYLSPVFGDLSGIAPSIIFVGGDEILLSDAEMLHARLKEAGSQSELIVRPEMWHTYVLYNLKSHKQDYDLMSRFIRRNMPEGNERKLKWMHIDNAGKIYPASRTSRWNNLFRLSMTLTEDIDREILQAALDVTVRRFPSIAVRLHRGVFWYYLEEIPHAPRIQDEKSYPLAHMPFDDIRHCAFRVLVYKKRIACEFFHALTDGNGAMIFLKSLVAEYLTERYGVHIPATDGVLDRLEQPSPDEYRDLFPKYKGRVAKPRKDTIAYRIHGTGEEDFFCHLTSFRMKTDELLGVSRKMGVTLTSLLAAAIIKAAIVLQNHDVPIVERQKEIKVLIPCDLRRIYGEDTLRNFMLYVIPGVDPKLGEYTLEEIAKIVQYKMNLEISQKNIGSMIAANVRDEDNILMKLAPLFLKNIAMKLVFNLIGERTSTLTMSNLGRVKMPTEMEAYVDDVDFVLGVQSSGPYNASVISYKDMLTLNIIRDIKEPRLEREFWCVLRELGIHAKVESNER